MWLKHCSACLKSSRMFAYFYFVCILLIQKCNRGNLWKAHNVKYILLENSFLLQRPFVSTFCNTFAIFAHLMLIMLMQLFSPCPPSISLWLLLAPFLPLLLLLSDPHHRPSLFSCFFSSLSSVQPPTSSWKLSLGSHAHDSSSHMETSSLCMWRSFYCC